MNEDDLTRTDVDAAAELAAEPVFVPVDPGETFGVALPPGWTFDSYDEERHLARPRRASGLVEVLTADAFVAAVNRLADVPAEVTVYADEDALGLVAVLNDDVAGGPGWRDHRVALALRPTPEWLLWAGKDGNLLSQEAFAEHIEAGVNELRDPAPAVMLDIAQTFHATVGVNVRSGSRLADGRVQFRYEENIDATAGDNADLTIPSILTMAIKPFVGGPAYEMTARFRYRLPRGGGAVQMGYTMVRPAEVKRTAYLAIAEKVRADLTGATHLAAKAPATA